MHHRGSGLQILTGVLFLGAVLCRCASGTGQSAGDLPLSGDTPAVPARPVGTDAAAGATRNDASLRIPDPADAGEEPRTEDARYSPSDAPVDVFVDARADALVEARAATLADSAPDAAADATGDAASGSVADGPAEGPPCDASADPKDTPCVIDDAYAVFVSGSGADGAAGTMADPLRTISAGIAKAVKAGKTRVYACRGAYSESVVLDARHDGLEVYGGFACVGGWRWTGEKAQVQPQSALRYALRVESTTKPTLVQDIGFTSGDPGSYAAQTVAQSSIAAFVQSASPLTLVRVQLHAGAGAFGQDGPPVMSNDPSAVPMDLAGNAGTPGGAPGAPKRCVCASWGDSTGGAGGSPSSTTGGDGLATPAAVPDPSSGRDGLGRGALPPLLLDCLPGDTGANGWIQTGGGGAAQSLGSVTASGWVPAQPGDGLPGNPGQGGGGGGADNLGLGDTGGGGGCGGCGGAGGTAGQSGGASIALLVFASTVTLYASELITSDGGGGGWGRTGGRGTNGGVGGTGGGGCAGGAGGNGAGGGGGPGGAGGVSIGILHSAGSSVNLDTMTTITCGAGGLRGSGALGGFSGTGAATGERGADGLDGVSVPVLSL